MLAAAPGQRSDHQESGLWTSTHEAAKFLPSHQFEGNFDLGGQLTQNHTQWSRGIPFMIRKILAISLSAIVLAGMVGFAALNEEEPKYTISEVMGKAHKSGLLKKVTKGGASEEDKEKLLEYYKALAANDPPKGTEEDWKKKTMAIVKAAEGVVKGDADAAKKLGAATNCAACHKVHKP